MATFDNEIRIVIVGKTGTGKSSTGNTILNRMEFQAKNKFRAVTDKSAFGTRTLNKKKLVVIDTPGILDTHRDREEMKKEIVKSIGLSVPGPHAVLYVMRIGDRLTDDEHNSLRIFIDMFGEPILDVVILVFTRGDDLEGESLTQYFEDATPQFKNLLKKCSNRMIALNNKGTACEKAQAVDNLLAMIDKMSNGQTYYSDEMHKSALVVFMKRVEEIGQVDKVRIEIENEGITFKYLLALGFVVAIGVFLSGITIGASVVIVSKLGNAAVAAGNAAVAAVNAVGNTKFLIASTIGGAKLSRKSAEVAAKTACEKGEKVIDCAVENEDAGRVSSKCSIL